MQEGNRGGCLHFGICACVRGSGGTVQTHRMMRYILVKVGQHQQQIQHPLALLRNRIAHFFLQILDNQERVGQQPFQIGGTQRALFPAASEGVVGADQGLVEKMIEAELFACKRRGDRVPTWQPSAMSQNASIHGHTPFAPGSVISEARGAERIIVSSALRKYPGTRIGSSNGRSNCRSQSVSFARSWGKGRIPSLRGRPMILNRGGWSQAAAP